MKRRMAAAGASVIAMVSIAGYVWYDANHMTLDEAIRASDVKMDEVFHTVDHDGHAILFYGEGDWLSVGLVEKTPLGYRWSFGAGSDPF